MVKLTVLEESPELHSIHGERVVRTLVQTQPTVERVDGAQVRHVPHDHENHLNNRYASSA